MRKQKEQLQKAVRQVQLILQITDVQSFGFYNPFGQLPFIEHYRDPLCQVPKQFKDPLSSA